MPDRGAVPLAAAIMVMSLIVACSSGEAPSDAPDPTAPLDASPGAATEPRTGADAGRPTVTLDGEGASTTDEVELESGLARLSFRHGGSGPLSIAMIDADGRQMDVVDSVHGSGSVALVVRASGTHTFSVDVEGPWRLAIRPVPTQPTATLPLSLRGIDPTLSEPFVADGEVSLRVRTQGRARLELRFFPVGEGAGERVVVDEPGEVTERVRLAQGTYVLEVRPRGSSEWTVEVIDRPEG